MGEKITKQQEMDKKITLSQKAYQLLKNKIITFELKPGEKIDENKLSQMLSLGRTPIREALFRLHAENLVDYHNHSGIYVKDISFKSVKDFFEAYVPIEMAVAQIAPLRIDENSLNELEEINLKINRAIEKKDYLDITIQNSLFHKHIGKITDNNYLFAFVERLQSEGQRLAYLCFSKQVSLDKSLEHHFQQVKEQHQKIINELKKGNIDSLKKIIIEHVQLFQSRITKYLTIKF